VDFNPAWGGPSSITFPAPTDWTAHEWQGIRYYSGTAEYTKTFQFSPVGKGAKVLLDLGVCHHHLQREGAWSALDGPLAH
jgi:hypothetical protein